MESKSIDESLNTFDSNIDEQALDYDDDNDYFISSSDNEEEPNEYDYNTYSNKLDNKYKQQSNGPFQNNNHSNSVITPLDHIQTNKSRKSIISSTKSFGSASTTNKHSYNRQYSNQLIPTRQSTFNSTIDSADLSYDNDINNDTGNKIGNSITSDSANIGGTITGTPTRTGTNIDSIFYKQTTYDDYDKDIDTFDGLDDYNRKLKLGDKLKTSIPVENERQYKDLQIIDEISNLQKLNFFSENYVNNLEKLKLSQLTLLIKMVQLTENSFEEFHNIWNNLESKIDRESENAFNSNANFTHNKTNSNNINNSNNKKSSVSHKEVDGDIINNDDKSIDKNLISSLSSQMAMSSISIKNDKKNIQNTKSTDTIDKKFVTCFDINNSKGFELMNNHKLEILDDLDKINKEIDKIDRFTNSMWDTV